MVLSYLFFLPFCLLKVSWEGKNWPSKLSLRGNKEERAIKLSEIGQQRYPSRKVAPLPVKVRGVSPCCELTTERLYCIFLFFFSSCDFLRSSRKFQQKQSPRGAQELRPGMSRENWVYRCTSKTLVPFSVKDGDFSFSLSLTTDEIERTCQVCMFLFCLLKVFWVDQEQPSKKSTTGE